MSEPASKENALTVQQQQSQLETRVRGFLARELVMATLPHKEPENPHHWVRSNGDFTLIINGGADKKGNPYGLPYGSIPRLILLWITSVAVGQQDRRIKLGDTLNQFLLEVGLNPRTGGGARGDAKRVKEQLIRLLNASISFHYEEGTAKKGSIARLNMQIAGQHKLWWDFENPEQGGFWNSYIVLGEEFFNAITTAPVPIHLPTLRHIKQSPLAIDLYTWAVWRLYRMKQGEQITFNYQELKEQFGTGYTRLDHFKTAVRDALLSIKEVFPALKYDLSPRGLVLEGIRHNDFPIMPKLKNSPLDRRPKDDPLGLSTNQIARAMEHAPKLDQEERRELYHKWRAWCQGKELVPDKPGAHFIAFVKTHVKTNP